MCGKLASDKVYRVSTQAVKWVDARDACRKWGGDVASVAFLGLNTYMMDLLDNFDYYWVQSEDAGAQCATLNAKEVKEVETENVKEDTKDAKIEENEETKATSKEENNNNNNNNKPKKTPPKPKPVVPNKEVAKMIVEEIKKPKYSLIKKDDGFFYIE